MKIGIITFHCAHNYGAVLQAYAFSSYLRSQGYDASIIDYRPNYLVRGYARGGVSCWLAKSPIRTVRKCVTEPFLMKMRAERWDKFNDFINNRLPLYPFDRFKNDSEFDIVFYGSDQIWNTVLTKGNIDDIYWGKYSKSRAVSYAVSMGEYYPSGVEKKKVSELLANFMAFSARESGVKAFIESTTKKNAKLVCDPVFLLPRELWESSIPVVTEKPYVLCYNLLHSKKCKKQAHIISELMGIQLIEIYGDIRLICTKSKTYMTLGPLEFVSYIRNASFIVTSSFHGTAFSIVFQKPFYSLGLQKRSDRVKNLLKLVGLEDRYLTDVKSNVELNLNYETASDKLCKYIADSKEFLKEVIHKNC